MPRPAHDREPPPPTTAKSVWRQWAKGERQLLDPIEIGKAVASGLQRAPLYESARHVLIYLAFGHEPDLAPLLSASDKTFYTTRTEEATAAGAGPGILTLHRLDPHDLERHRFGFLQPSPLAPPAAAEIIDLVLVPGLAFDLRGHRLGFGMGYYDRLLSTLRADVPRVGITPAALVVPRLPSEEHDVRMSHLATESGATPVEG